MLTTGIFPDKLKIAKVVPIYKKGENTQLCNYRPISRLPAISKVIDNQYGFRTEHSTEFAALELADRVITCMDHNETPINIYLDLSKAFDTLDHEILMAKLEYYGIHGTPLELVKSYLTNRKQYVEIEDTQSKMLDISTGVPQGPILGQLLFIIYVNDFALSSEKFKFVMYADDTTLTSTLETFSTNELNGNTASSINIEQNKISEWLKLNRLTLNVQKIK